MKRKLFLSSIVIMTIFWGCASKEVIPFKDRYKVAILPVKSDLSQEEKAKWENLVEQTLTTELLEEQRVRLIERGQIDRLMKEQELIQKGLVDEKNAAKIGKMLGADAVLIADLYLEKDESLLEGPMVKHKKVKYIVRVSGKIIDVETGEILAAATDTDQKEEDGGIIISDGTSEDAQKISGFHNKKEKEVINSLIADAADDVAEDLSDMMPAKH